MPRLLAILSIIAFAAGCQITYFTYYEKCLLAVWQGHRDMPTPAIIGRAITESADEYPLYDGHEQLKYVEAFCAEFEARRWAR